MAESIDRENGAGDCLESEVDLETLDEAAELDCLLPLSENNLPVYRGLKLATETKTSKTPRDELTRRWRLNFGVRLILNYSISGLTITRKLRNSSL